ncbi:MAG: DNA-binding protein WhiA [Thermotogaceae bacterium]|nr:DNA-binding protein WhiA [Thermotogaceae bacterium]
MRTKRSTFSDEVKDELVRFPILSKDEVKYEFLGFIKARGSVELRRGDILVSLGSFSAARRLVTIIRYLKLCERSLEIFKEERLGRKRIVLNLRNEGILPDILNVGIPEDTAFFSSFLRGFFLSSGSVTDPRYHYHLEMSTFDKRILESIKEKLLKLFGIKSNIVSLKYNFRIYIKSSRDIIEFLNIVGAYESVKFYEKIVEERSIKSDVNRSLNFISANAVRVGTSNARQIEAIRKIIESVGLEVLPEELRRIAVLRLENEDLSLRELGYLMDPPMTKAMVYRRIKKIMDIASRIGGDEM